MMKLFTKTICMLLIAVLCINNLKAQEETSLNRAFSWIKWSGTYGGLCVGTSTGGSLNWKVGARWTAADLGSKGVVAGDRITKVRFAAAQLSYITSCTIEIYQGGAWPSQGTLVRTQNVSVSSLTQGGVSEIVLTTPVNINVNQELWVVYRIAATAGYPFGIDANPTVNQKGNIAYVNNSWTTLSTMGIEGNFILEFYTETSPPAITTTTLPNGGVGVSYSQTITATGTTPITWSIDSGELPDGLTLSTTGVISGTPTTTETFDFTVKATNSVGFATRALSIAVLVPPVITTNDLPNGITGTAYSQTLTTDGGTPVTWSVENGDLPNGLTLSTGGVISGTPTTTGTFNFIAKATNSAGFDTKALEITILSPPVITTNSLPNGGVEIAYSQTLTATGTSPIAWSMESGILPDGLTLSEEGMISGTPTTAGTFSFTIKATNSVSFNTKALSITIIAPPAITTNDLPNGIKGTAYNQTLAADGGTPITWSTESGNLPHGLILSTAGLISGIPTTVGTFNFTVKATNSVGSDTKALSVLIEEGVGITENELPNFTVYPNPTDGQLRIANYEIRDKNYQIFSVLGQIIIQGKLQEDTTIINVTSLAKGIYYLQIGDKMVKFVKE